MYVWICSFFLYRGLFNDVNMSCHVAMSNQELINAGTKTMDETDQAIVRTQKVYRIKKHELSEMLLLSVFLTLEINHL